MAYDDHHILRLIHFNNLEDILKNGMYSKNSVHVIPDYVNIGDTTLIKQRETFTVRIDPPNGNLGDYIPFYFAGHSPMLLRRLRRIAVLETSKILRAQRQTLRMLLAAIRQTLMPLTFP